MKELLKAKSEFRKKGVVLVADKTKSGGGGSWKFVSEDMFIKTIQKPLTEVGLELFSTMKYVESLGVDLITVTLFHTESGESIESSISMSPVEPKNDRNGNPLYLDAEIERGKQFGYWTRILGIRILGLSDIDPESMDKAQEDLTTISSAQVEEIKKLVAETNSDESRMLDFAQVEKYEDITVPVYEKLKKALEAKSKKQ